MILFGIKAGVDEEGVTKKVIVEITDNGKTLKETTLDIGEEYKVVPYNERKMKHRDRIGVIKSFKKDDDKGELKAHLQFTDNNNLGWANVEDLESV